MQIRTDLAMEAIGPDGARGKTKFPGVKVAIWEESGISVTEVVIDEEAGARMMGKPLGRYVTLECGGVRTGDPEIRRAVSSLLAEELTRMLPAGEAPVMVVGLGNRQVTPDALGPMTVSVSIGTSAFSGSLASWAPFIKMSSQSGLNSRALMGSDMDSPVSAILWMAFICVSISSEARSQSPR